MKRLALGATVSMLGLGLAASVLAQGYGGPYGFGSKATADEIAAVAAGSRAASR